MPNQQSKDPDQRPHQQGAPQETQEMPSSGNSPPQSSGTDERAGDGQDVERSGGGGGTATQRSTETGAPGTSPSKTTGIESPERRGNE